MNDDVYKALELLDHIVIDLVHSNTVSYLAGLCVCNHVGLVEEGVRLFDIMKGFGGKLNVKHYGECG